MEKNYGKEKYISLIKAWEKRAEKIRDEKYNDWHAKVDSQLESPVLKSRLARLLGIHDPMELPKLGTTNQLIAAVTGFSDASIEKLRYMPSDDRGLMFAFAFVLGFEYRLVTTNDGKLLVHCDNELKQYFDDADMRLPDYHILEDYIYICANMYYEECNAGKHYGESRIITLAELQKKLRDQLDVYMLELDAFPTWTDFYEYYASQHKLTNADIKKATDLGATEIRKLKDKEPEKADILFMICILFRFNMIQTIHVFDRFWHEEDDLVRPDLQNPDDLRWLYLAENYWQLKDLGFKKQCQIVKNFYEENKITHSADLTIPQYYEIFRQLEFTMDKKNETHHMNPEKTQIVNDREDLAELAAVSDYDRVFIHVKKGEDPVKYAATEFSLGSKMDILHASDPARILWYRKKVKGRKKDASEDLIKEIYYRKKDNDMDANLEKGSELLLDWIGNNAVNGYLTNNYDIGNKKTIPMNTRLSNLQRKQGEYPKRKELIIIGVIINMPEKGINQLLKSYGYKQLSSHDYTEYVLTLILKDMQKYFPQEFYFEAPYTANRADNGGGTQNIGARRKADRGNREGSLSLIMDWYPRWFYDQAGKIHEEVCIPQNFLDNENWYQVTPSEYFVSWSIRKFVLYCLYTAGFAKTNWLVAGLSNPQKEEIYSAEDIVFDY